MENFNMKSAKFIGKNLANFSKHSRGTASILAKLESIWVQQITAPSRSRRDSVRRDDPV